MTTATISSKGWIVIPSELRRKYNLRSGSRIVLVDYGGVLALVPAFSDPLEQAAGLLKHGPSLTEALLVERSQERARER
jgi:AbrB family looped-hinge helix DNA binding protein